MENNYEKLQLSKQDLKYVYQQILNSILDKLDLHLPTSDDDPLKNTVTNLLHDYIKEIFDMAKNALVIDGVDMSQRNASTISEVLSLKPREKTESFDFELNATLKEVLQNIEQETIEVTNLRKQIPQEFGEKYEDVVTDADKLVTEFLTYLDQQSDKEKESEPVNEPAGSDAGIIPRLDQMVEDYETHLMQLHQLKDSIPTQRAEIDKLNEITQFLQDKYNEDMNV